MRATSALRVSHLRGWDIHSGQQLAADQADRHVDRCYLEKLAWRVAREAAVKVYIRILIVNVLHK